MISRAVHAVVRYRVTQSRVEERASVSTVGKISTDESAQDASRYWVVLSTT